MLDNEEFALAMHLIKVKCDGYNLPEQLPDHLIPPSHRKQADVTNGDTEVTEEVNGN